MVYSDDPRFSRYVLEESFVLGIHVGVDWAVVELDACLSRDHPDADSKASGDWTAFRPAQLWFKLASVQFQPSNAPAALDSDESWDYGTVDRFELLGTDEFLIEGEFGRLAVKARDVFVKEFSDG